MIGLFVSDLPKMTGFYRDLMRIEIDWNGEGPYAGFDYEGIRFAMFERQKLPTLLKQERAFPSGLNETFELAVNVRDRTNVEAGVEDVEISFRTEERDGGVHVIVSNNGPGLPEEIRDRLFVPFVTR